MKKLITCFIVMLLSIICVTNYAYAAGEQLQATIEITPSSNKVVAGDTVTFTFVTKNITNAESGKIFAIGGKMVYNTDFFEAPSFNGITYSEDTGLFNSTNAVSEGGTNGTITLRVKSDATGSSTVEFTELEASDGRLEDMETLGVARTENQNFTITVDNGGGNENPPAEGGNGNENPPVEGGNGNENPPVEGGNGNENPPVEGGNGDENPPAEGGNGNENPPPAEEDDNKNSPSTGGTTVVVGDKDDTTANKEIPKAGINTMLTIGIVAIAMLSIVMYAKNKKYEDIK